MVLFIVLYYRVRLPVLFEQRAVIGAKLGQVLNGVAGFVHQFCDRVLNWFSDNHGSLPTPFLESTISATGS